MSYTLVIVDMQYYFKAARNSRVRSNCIREINQAIKDGAGIIVLEYEGCGRTLPSLTRILKNYPKYFCMTKGLDDGSEEVLHILNSHQLFRSIKIIGVNTDCCVYETATSLSRLFSINWVDIIADACNSDIDHECGIRELSSFQNISIKRYLHSANI